MAYMLSQYTYCFGYTAIDCHNLLYSNYCQCIFTHASDFISIGWESPAGQTYASASDLGKLMALMFSTDKPYNPQTQQVCIVRVSIAQCVVVIYTKA